jgi:hypothetical protein
MWRLLKLTSLLVLLLALTISIAVLIGRMQPPPERLAALHMTYCAPPCWIGIMPGTTTQGEVEALFGEAYPHHEPFFIRLQRLSRCLAHFRITFRHRARIQSGSTNLPMAVGDAGGGLQIQTYSTIESVPASTDIVHSIFIADMDKSGNNVMADSPLMPHLGDVLALWGPPTCMFADAPDFWRLHYNMGEDGLSVIDIMVKGHQMRPGQAIFYLILYRTPPEYGTDCLRQGSKHWLGFANPQRYGFLQGN